MPRMNLEGKRFTRLLVVSFSHIENSRTYWKCVCDCGNEIVINGKYLRCGDTKSCGCLNDESRSINGKNNKKYNEYKIENGIVHIYLGNEYMICEESDWNEETKYIKWFLNNSGYARGRNPKTNKLIFFHNMIMKNSLLEEVDHINRNRLDNRRCNLRIVTKKQNLKNKSIYSNNSSGTTGVSWHKSYMKWGAQISIDGTSTLIGYFDNKEDAIIARKKAEEIYYKEYRRMD